MIYKYTTTIYILEILGLMMGGFLPLLQKAGVTVIVWNSALGL